MLHPLTYRGHHLAAISLQELCIEEPISLLQIAAQQTSVGHRSLESGEIGEIGGEMGEIALTLAAPAHRAVDAVLNASSAALVEGGAAVAAALTLHNASGLASAAGGFARAASGHVAALAHRAHDATQRHSHRRRGLRGGGGGGGGGSGDDDEGGPLRWLNPTFGSFDDFATSMVTTA